MTNIQYLRCSNDLTARVFPTTDMAKLHSKHDSDSQPDSGIRFLVLNWPWNITSSTFGQLQEAGYKHSSLWADLWPALPKNTNIVSDITQPRWYRVTSKHQHSGFSIELIPETTLPGSLDNQRRQETAVVACAQDWDGVMWQPTKCWPQQPDRVGV